MARAEAVHADDDSSPSVTPTPIAKDPDMKTSDHKPDSIAAAHSAGAPDRQRMEGAR